MKYYFSEIIPKLRRYSKTLDFNSILTSHNWISFNPDSSNKLVYIFKEDGVLLISEKGRVQKSKWTIIDSDSLIIEIGKETLLFRSSFLDENHLILNLDDTMSFAFFLNEKYNSIVFKNFEDIIDKLNEQYLTTSEREQSKSMVKYETDLGVIEIEAGMDIVGKPAYYDGNPAPNGRYCLGFLWYVTIENGLVVRDSFF